ncbi:unnamed protein product [Arabidopsis halleri]
MDPIESVDYNGFETIKCNSDVDHGSKKVVSRKQKPADQSAKMVAAYVEDEWSGAGEAISKSRSNCDGDEGYDFDNEIATKDVNLKAEETNKPKPNKETKPKVSLAEAAAKIDPWDLADSLAKISVSARLAPLYKPALLEMQLLRFVDYLGITLSAVQFPWLETFKPWPKLIDLIDVPLSHIPEPVYKTSVDWLYQFPIGTLAAFVLLSLNHILTNLEQGGPKGGDNGQQRTTSKSHVAIFVALAMVLRIEPNTLVIVLPTLKEYKYRGHDKLPIIVWMVAQASQGDLSVGLHSWASNLLPLVLVDSNPHSMDLILQLVEKILSTPNARTILLNGVVIEELRLVSPYAFEILMRRAFPSARVKATERFEAIYPLLKEVALAGEPGSKSMKQVTQEIFYCSLVIAGKGNPALATEATAMAIWSLTENVECCKQWERLNWENQKGSAAVLKKLEDEWNDISLKLSSSPSHTITLIQTMKNIRLKNKKATIEADKSCKVILGRLFRESGCLKGTAIITAVVLAAAVILSSNL